MPSDAFKAKGEKEMADYAISSANLSAIENGLNAINRNLGTLNNNLKVIGHNVDTINSNVKVVYDEIGALARDFNDFVQLQVRANALSKAQQRVIQIRQTRLKKACPVQVIQMMEVYLPVWSDNSCSGYRSAKSKCLLQQQQTMFQCSHPNFCVEVDLTNFSSLIYRPQMNAV